jgi:sugar lactone lactonase YvrE
VDSDGYLWITGTGNANNRGSVCRVNSTGTAVTAGTAANAVTQPTAVAVDGSNNAWVINGTGNVVYKVGIGSGGVASVSNAFGGGGLSGNPSAGPVALTVDGSGNIWTVNYNSTTSFSSISELSSSGVGISDSNYGYQGGNITQPTGISVDISGDLWVANTGGGGVVEVIGIATPTAAYLKMTPGTKP